MVACENQKDLWRCGDSKYFNGYEAEEPEIDGNGDPVYMRDFFPGKSRAHDDAHRWIFPLGAVIVDPLVPTGFGSAMH